MRVPVVQHSTRRRRALRRRTLWTGGELLVTVGVVLLLLVVHQLWWTNRQAQHNAERKVQALEREWGSPSASPGGADSAGDGGSSPSPGSSDGRDTPSPTGGQRQGGGAVTAARALPDLSQAYAVLTIPRLSLRVPVAEGVGKQDVLNKGYVGHYKGTQQPGQAGNFALAGHRNTHGEPFRYINRLRRGDTITVETKAALYTYVVDTALPQTSARDGGVIARVPRSTVRPSYGYSEPGYYITLTTCTPEYTSKYRMAVWGKLRSMRPR
ncbi:class E sortase [Streptomyces sp. NPDC058246]|uniref:class E sortase n=1 Tax=Streptomyces sp. NPDC058246 TaxID=3346400 RepID=UPI0036E41A79